MHGEKLIQRVLPGIDVAEFSQHFRRHAPIALGIVATGWALLERAERRDLETTNSELREEREIAYESRDAYEQESLSDPLTGLPNFRALLRVYNECVEENKPFGLMYVDVDSFKAVNDKLGHAAGDSFLTMTGSYLTHVIREEDDATITRKGGDEYAVLVLLDPRPESESHLDPEQRMVATASRLANQFSQLPEILRYNAAVSENDQTGITIGTSLFRGQALPMMLNEADPKGELGNKYLKLMTTQSYEVPELEVARAEFARHLPDND